MFYSAPVAVSQPRRFLLRRDTPPTYPSLRILTVYSDTLIKWSIRKLYYRIVSVKFRGRYVETKD